MNVAPGWYQDPEGPAGQARYWDGTRWAPRSQGPDHQPGQEPGGGRPRWLVPTIVGLAVVLVVGLGIWLVPPLLSPDDDPTEEPTVTEPVDPTTDPQTTPGGSETTPDGGGPVEVGELNCAAARSTNFEPGPEFRVAGIVVPFPVHEDWGFRFDSSQWPWVNDLHAWGTVDIEPKGEGWAAGAVVGRLEAGNGFGDVEQAATAVVECLTTYGPFNTGEEMDVTASEAVTVDGMPGWSMEMAYPEEGTYGATDIRVLTLDSGQEGNLAMVIGFNPQGHDATAAILDEMFEGITTQ